MPIPGLNKDRCEARNRVAAKRDGVNAAPVRFLRGNPSGDASAAWSRGTLPKDDAEALARINANLPAGAPELGEADVYIHYIEAANNSFVGDRFMFLGASTLKNIAANAQDGFAFMNSHRTGGLSHPSELPFGRTFAGRYEQTGNADDGFTRRALVGFYMLSGQKPNGANGPTTDDLHSGINGGTIFDVSVGLWGGKAVCDVCGEDLNAVVEDEDTWSGYSYLCPHVPGTAQAMSDEDKAAQRERGVPAGFASYTLTDARCGEVSAVYDGAVTGAGFQKALDFARRGALSSAAAREAQSAYSALSGKGDIFTMPLEAEDLEEHVEPMIKRIFNRIGFGNHGEREGMSAHVKPTPPANPPQDTPPAQSQPEPPHPVLSVALAAGLDTPEKFAAMKANADAFTQGKRDAADQAASLYFADKPAELAQAQETIKTASLPLLETLTNTWNAAHDSKFGISQGQGANQQTPPADVTPGTPPAAEAAAARNKEQAELAADLNPSEIFGRRNAPPSAALNGNGNGSHTGGLPAFNYNTHN